MIILLDQLSSPAARLAPTATPTTFLPHSHAYFVAHAANKLVPFDWHPVCDDEQLNILPNEVAAEGALQPTPQTFQPDKVPTPTGVLVCSGHTKPACPGCTEKQGVCLCVRYVNCPTAERASINSTRPELTGEGPAPRQGLTVTLSYAHAHTHTARHSSTQIRM